MASRPIVPRVAAMEIAALAGSLEHQAKEPERIKVAVRCRPALTKEQDEQLVRLDRKARTVVTEALNVRTPRSEAARDSRVDSESTTPRAREGQPRTPRGAEKDDLSFDFAFPPETTNQEVYTDVVGPVVESVIEGYNGTVFCYGCTGSGKTYTIMGPHSASKKEDPVVDFSDLPPDAGMIPRAVKQVFDAIEDRTKMNPDSRYLVSVSFLEFYQGTLHDLLAPPKAQPRIRMKGNPRYLEVTGLTRVHARTAEDVLEALKFGQRHQHFRSTSVSEHSSRSHSVFTIQIEHGMLRDADGDSDEEFDEARTESSLGVSPLPMDRFRSPRSAAAWNGVPPLLASAGNQGTPRRNTVAEMGPPARTLSAGAGLQPWGLKTPSASNTPRTNTPRRNTTLDAGAGGPIRNPIPENGRPRQEGDDVADRLRCGKLHLVDLAGAESAKMAMTSGEGLREACHINTGLSCLGNVIAALNSQSSHVPFRDDKLTMFLADSLGGNARTTMIANISPERASFAHTASTLRFAQRVNRVLNVPQVNWGSLSSSRVFIQMIQMEENYREQLAALRRQLAASDGQVDDLEQRMEELRQQPPAPGGLTPEESASLREQVEQLRAETREKERANEDLKSQLGQQETETRLVRARTMDEVGSDFEDRIRERESRIRDLETQNRELQQEVRSLEARAKEDSRELEQLRSKLRTGEIGNQAENARTALEAALTEAREGRKLAATACEDLRAQLADARAQGQGEGSQAQLEVLKKIKSMLEQQDHTGLHAAVTTLQNHLSDLTTSLSSARDPARGEWPRSPLGEGPRAPLLESGRGPPAPGDRGLPMEALQRTYGRDPLESGGRSPQVPHRGSLVNLTSPHIMTRHGSRDSLLMTAGSETDFRDKLQGLQERRRLSEAVLHHKELGEKLREERQKVKDLEEIVVGLRSDLVEARAAGSRELAQATAQLAASKEVHEAQLGSLKADLLASQGDRRAAQVAAAAATERIEALSREHRDQLRAALDTAEAARDAQRTQARSAERELRERLQEVTDQRDSQLADLRRQLERSSNALQPGALDQLHAEQRKVAERLESVLSAIGTTEAPVTGNWREQLEASRTEAQRTTAALQAAKREERELRSALEAQTKKLDEALDRLSHQQRQSDEDERLYVEERQQEGERYADALAKVSSLRNQLATAESEQHAAQFSLQRAKTDHDRRLAAEVALRQAAEDRILKLQNSRQALEYENNHTSALLREVLHASHNSTPRNPEMISTSKATSHYVESVSSAVTEDAS